MPASVTNFDNVTAANGATPTDVTNVTLWYSFEGGPWTLYGDDPSLGDGNFPVDVSGIGGDGTYDWFLVAFDMAENHEPYTFVSEDQTFVDSTDPVIGATTIDKDYIHPALAWCHY